MLNWLRLSKWQTLTFHFNWVNSKYLVCMIRKVCMNMYLLINLYMYVLNESTYTPYTNGGNSKIKLMNILGNPNQKVFQSYFIDGVNSLLRL